MSWLTRKDPDAGKDWGQEEKGTTERLNSTELNCKFGQMLGKIEGRRRRGRQRMRRLDGVTDWIDMSSAAQSCPTSFYQVKKWKCWSFSPVRLFVTPWAVAHQAPLSMGFSRQEYWSGLPFPPKKGCFWPRDQNCIFCIGRQIFFFLSFLFFFNHLSH